MSKKEEKRLKIIEVTADLCIRNGYQGTSVDELTAETELIFSGLIASLPISKNTDLIDIAKERYLREIFESSR